MICTDNSRIAEGVLREAFIPLAPSVQTVGQAGTQRALWAGCGCVFGIRATYIILSNPAPPSTPCCFLAHTLHHQLCQHAVCVAHG